MDYQYLVDEAFKARENAYTPYSHFKVGACCELNDGKLIYGANIENAAYGSTMCVSVMQYFRLIAKATVKRILKHLRLLEMDRH